LAKKRLTEEDLKNMGLSIGEDGLWAKKSSTPTPSFEEESTTEIRSTEPLVFVWAEKHVSLNDWYSSEHWSKRNKTKTFWHKFFKDSLPKEKPYFHKYTIELLFNSRLDPSNTITMIKLCEDSLQKEGIIDDDSSKHCRGIYISPCDDMKKFSYKIIVKKA
jgi:hypothetical protein